MRFSTQIVPVCLFVMAASACAESPGEEPAGVIPRDQASAPVAADSHSQSEEANVHDTKLEALAVNTLARQLSIAPDQVSMVSMTARDWPDSSLGCPQPGVSYLQVVTPGYQATMSAGGKPYSVHMTNKYAVVCETVTPGLMKRPEPSPPPADETE